MGLAELSEKKMGGVSPETVYTPYREIAGSTEAKESPEKQKH